MHSLVVGTYPPRLCGIATFTADVVDAMAAIPEVKRPVVAAVMTRDEPRRPHAVSSDIGAVIEQENGASYRAAALVANTFDVVLIEHEFGIFGGPDGEMLLGFVDALDVPFVVSLHTVLPQPTANQKPRAAAAVRTGRGRDGVHRDRSANLARPGSGAGGEDPHRAPRSAVGALRAPGCRRRQERLRRAMAGRWSRRSGSCPRARASRSRFEPSSPFVRSCPTSSTSSLARPTRACSTSRGSGIARSCCVSCTALDIADNVRFVDRFMDLDDLAQLLAATDVFCTPYHNGDQIVSGALTFAIAAGRPTVSTPYRYAQDLPG